MSEQYTHNCIKCEAQYIDNEIDAYYCATCIEEKKKIANAIDKQISSRPRKKVKSGLQEYDEARGSMPFPPISKLGIKL